MVAGPRILTFNFHEPYLCLMAKTGLHFFVGQYENPPLARPWQTHYRPIPKNVTLLDERTWQRDLMAGKFDIAIAHNETNAVNIARAPCPKLLVCHNRKTFLNTTVTIDRGEAVKRYNELIDKLQQHFTFVFISGSKQDDYGVPGKVIPPGIDVEEYGGYTGAAEEILRVGNMMRERNLMFDVDFQEQVCKGLANRVVGDNPTIPGARAAASFEDLLDKFRRLRCLLHVTREGWEDGYNLAMLEALACGMPVVALANRTSPLTDGKDGFVSYDVGVLHKRVRELLADLDMARTLGARGRETVAAKFPINAFTDKWRRAIETAIEARTRRATRPRPRPRPKRLDILMHYLCSPLTTGRYFERAARKQHNVVTAGFRCPEDVLELWGFGEDIPEYRPHQIDLPLKHTFKDVVERLPQGFRPDVYLWIDSGPKQAPSDIKFPGVVKVCYLIDTHIAPGLRLAMAQHFDYTLLAQKAQVDVFSRAGIRNVTWLPLACSPELHDVGPLERRYDVAFICNPRGDHNNRRRDLMLALSERFPNSYVGKCWPEGMARIYAQSKVVVNACVNEDVNMRVFEAMASGALLITDHAIGLEDLFEDKKHLVIYRDDALLCGLIERYLEDAEARERIAAAGQALVLAQHTYDRRIEEMLNVVTRGAGRGVQPGGEMRSRPAGDAWLRRPEMVQHVPRSARRVLDVGCGTGEFGRELKERGIPEVIGIEREPGACAMAKEVLDDAIEGDIERMDLSFEDGHFDCITFVDVIEHLVEPTAVLRKVSRVLAPDGVILMSIPNVRYYEVVEMLANGRWEYQEAGILDREHLRFFTARDIREMVARAGLEVADMGPLWALPEDNLPLNLDGTLSLNRVTIGPLDRREYQEFLTHQYVVVAGKPGADRLDKARQALDARENQTAYALAQDAYGVDEAERGRVMASAVARLGRLNEAEALYAKALELAPDNAAIKGSLGTLYVAMNRQAEAKPLLEEATAQDPQNDRALGALGLVYVSEGRAEAALDCFRKALEANYENQGLVLHLIEVADGLARLEEVEDLVRRFADFHPGNADLAFRYAVVLNKLGKTTAARDQLNALLLLEPDHQRARDLLDSLGESGV